MMHCFRSVCRCRSNTTIWSRFRFAQLTDGSQQSFFDLNTTTCVYQIRFFASRIFAFRSLHLILFFSSLTLLYPRLLFSPSYSLFHPTSSDQCYTVPSRAQSLVPSLTFNAATLAGISTELKITLTLNGFIDNCENPSVKRQCAAAIRVVNTRFGFCSVSNSLFFFLKNAFLASLVIFIFVQGQKNSGDDFLLYTAWILELCVRSSLIHFIGV
jgi:hypothetical protein